MEDHVRHLHNLWEQMSESPLLSESDKDFDPQAQLHHMNRLGALYREMVFQLGYLTIPDRVSEWLDPTAGPQLARHGKLWAAQTL